MSGMARPGAFRDAAPPQRRTREHGFFTMPEPVFFEHVRLFTLAESLGGAPSLIEHPALSVGIEDVGGLVADLEQALAGMA
jgi:hypothetical protein